MGILKGVGFCLAVMGLFSALEGEPLTSPISVPLINTSDHLLIKVALGSNRNAYPYVFDTGSTFLCTALGKGRSWEGATYKQSPPGNIFKAAYGSGKLSYSGEIGTTTVTFVPREESGKRWSFSDIAVAVITHPPEMYPNWNADINASPARPPENAKTFGTLGAGLMQGKGTTGDSASVLQQIPVGGNLEQGFIVHSGGPNSPSGRLTIGLSREEIDRFPILVKMQPTTGSATTSTGQRAHFYPENQLEGTITLETREKRRYSAHVLVVADSGGLGLHLTHTKFGANEFNPPSEFVNRNGNLRDGIRFTLTVPGVDGRRGLEWSVMTGQRAYVDRVHLERGTNGEAIGSFNTGIALFHHFDVMFDITRGVMGFRPVEGDRL